jgi:hypothetical protein
MHPKVLSAEAWKLIRLLTGSGLLDGWTLCGGTGLALQLGHRYSEALHLFRGEDFETEALSGRLAEHGDLVVHDRAPGTLHVALRGLRLSFLRLQAPLLFAGTPYRGLVVADARDIAVMKVIAVGGRGTRKDFVDLHVYLRSGGSLEGTFDLLRRRFEGIDYNEYHLLKSLVFFEDAETEPMPTMTRPLDWDEVKAGIIAEVRRLS